MRDTIQKHLVIVLDAARNRADYLEELSVLHTGYGDDDAAKECLLEASEIRLACAELDQG